MKILIDLQHPAHLHFFRNLIALLESAGHVVKVTGRDKDILVALAQEYDLEVEVFGVARRGVANLAREMFHRQRKLLGIIRHFKPDCMMAIAGTYISSLGRLLGVPVYIFYDTELATISNLLAYPFATCIYLPQCYRHRIRWTHQRYNGYHELAYLHPDYFTPDPRVLLEAGLKEGEPFTIMRFVAWGAVHDIGLMGFTDENKRRAVKECARFGKVFISSEGPLPPELESHRLKLKVSRIHDLMAYASLVFGESATMASEAAVLGVPSVYVDKVGRGYTDEEEREYGLVFNFMPEDQMKAVEKGREILADYSAQIWKAKGRRLVEEKIDVTGLLYQVATQLPHTRKSAG